MVANRKYGQEKGGMEEEDGMRKIVMTSARWIRRMVTKQWGIKPGYFIKPKPKWDGWVIKILGRKNQEVEKQRRLEDTKNETLKIEFSKIMKLKDRLHLGRIQGVGSNGRKGYKIK